jgi:hypothetical protein
MMTERVLFPVDAFRAVIKHAEESAGSLVGGIPNLIEGRARIEARRVQGRILHRRLTDQYSDTRGGQAERR